MATPGRTTDSPLNEILFEEGYRFDFFQAVRVLERLYERRRAVGGDAAPAEEVVRFGARLGLSFPPSAICSIDPPDAGHRPPRMTVNFMGLTGPMGALPHHYSELLMDRVRQRDLALRDFLDLFNHRLVALFYRAWEKYHFVEAYERAALRHEEDDRLSRILLALMGLGTDGLERRASVEHDALLFYSALFAHHPRSASGLQALLADYFQVRVQIVQFIGEWLAVAQEDRTVLGGGKDSNILGGTAFLGRRAWHQQSAFRIEIGPLTLSAFSEFLPSGGAHWPLLSLTRFFVGQELNFEVQLILLGREVPPLRLGAPAERAPRLGWSTWLGRHHPACDAADTVLRGAAARGGALPE